MLPGLMRTQCAPASIAFSASVWLKWMSAITGIGDSTTIRSSAAHVVVARHGAAHQVAAGVGDRVDLPHGRLEVRGLGLRHRLDRDGRPAADLHPADVDLSLGGHRPPRVSRRTAPRSRFAYFSSIGLRLSFIVGVSSSPPGCHSSGQHLNFLICSTRAICSLAASTPALCTSAGDGLARPCCCGERGRDVGVERDQRDVVGPPVADRDHLADQRARRPSPSPRCSPATCSCRPR